VYVDNAFRVDRDLFINFDSGCDKLGSFYEYEQEKQKVIK